MSLRARVAEFQLAVMLLTRLPAGRIGDDPPTMLAARWAFVPVGSLVGAMTWLVFCLAAAVGASPGAASCRVWSPPQHLGGP